MKQNNRLATLLGIAALGITPVGSCERKEPLRLEERASNPRGGKISDIDRQVLEQLYSYEGEDRYISKTMPWREADGTPIFMSFHMYINPRSLEEFSKGTSPPADVIVLSDLREIENASEINQDLYANMIWKGDIPAHIVMSNKTYRELQENKEFRKRFYSRVSENYDILIKDENTLKEVDPWSYLSGMPAPKGTYTRPQVK